jgi:hypothetical protein
MTKGDIASEQESTEHEAAAVADKAARDGKGLRHDTAQGQAGGDDVLPLSPNPMTNMLIAEIALRGGGRLLRHVVERGMLQTKYPPETAKNLVRGRGMVRVLLGATAARVATGSVPGAILIGGGLLAKVLYERGKGTKAAKKGEREIARRAAKGAS